MTELQGAAKRSHEGNHDVEIVPRYQWRKDQIVVQLVGDSLMIGSIDSGWCRMTASQCRALRNHLIRKFGMPTPSDER